jgi:maltose O-acetyltransferase
MNRTVSEQPHPQLAGTSFPALAQSPITIRRPDTEGSLHGRLLVARVIAGLLPPFAGNRLRMALLRAAGLRIGRSTIMWGMPRFIGGPDLHELLSIGAECGFNVGCTFEVAASITIGNHVSVGHDVLFLTRDYEAGSGAQRAGALRPAPIVVEDGTWVGARCTIMPGVRVGAGSVIGAGMVIGKDVPANTLLMGAQKLSLAKWR